MCHSGRFALILVLFLAGCNFGPASGYRLMMPGEKAAPVVYEWALAWSWWEHNASFATFME
jgi:hypothetical protein